MNKKEKNSRALGEKEAKHFPRPLLKKKMSAAKPENDNGKPVRYPFALKTLFTESEILARTRAVAQEIANAYRSLVSWEKPLVLIAVLKGSYLFLADLSRCLADLRIPCIPDFLCVSSYGGGTHSSGEVRMLLDLRTKLAGMHGLIVEDIVDGGHTLHFLKRLLKTRNPASLKTVTLLDKKDARKIPVEAEFWCFVCPMEFVIGYGLDYTEKYREIRDIVVLKPEYYLPASKL